MSVTSLALIGCGLLFLLEASIGLFWPGVYQLIAAASQGGASLRLRPIGGGLFACGVFFLAVGIPPREAAQLFLVVAGAAMVVKGTMMVGFPGALKDNPANISADPFRWKVKCGFRAAVGLALVVWGLCHGWTSS